MHIHLNFKKIHKNRDDQKEHAFTSTHIQKEGNN